MYSQWQLLVWDDRVRGDRRYSHFPREKEVEDAEVGLEAVAGAVNLIVRAGCESGIGQRMLGMDGSTEGAEDSGESSGERTERKNIVDKYPPNWAVDLFQCKPVGSKLECKSCDDFLSSERFAEIAVVECSDRGVDIRSLIQQIDNFQVKKPLL